MKKNEYLDNKISEIDDNIGSLKKKRLAKALIIPLLIFGVNVPVLAVLKLFFLYPGFVAVGAFDALMALCCYASVKYDSQDIRQLKTEKKHLKRIKEKGIKSPEELNSKRLERIYELTAQQDDYGSKNKPYGALLTAGIFASVVSAPLLFFAPVASIGVGVGLLSSLFALHGILENDDEITKLEARINNLKNDIELGPIYGRTNNNSTGASEARKTVNKNEDAKTFTYSPEQQEMVDQCIAELEKGTGNKNGKNKTYKKV